MKIGYDAKRIFHNTTGLGNYSRDLVRILSSYYPDNQYYLYNPKTPKINRLQIKDNMIVRQPKGLINKKIPSLWRSKFIIKDLLKDQIQIYHGLSGELPFGIEKTSIKSVVTIHDLIFLRFPELYKPIDRKIYTQKFKNACQIADKIVAISKQTKEDLISFFNISPENIEVIYQGCHDVFKILYLNKTKQEVLKKYKLPEHFLLNVGTIEERKNAFSIVKAIKNTDYNLVLVGRKTPYAEKIIEFIKENNMQNRIFFLENLNIKELAIIYQSADLFIYPSIYEGFGIPIIEALYSKIPVITNKHGVFSESGGPYSYYLEDVYNTDEIKQMIDEAINYYYNERVEKSHRFVQKFNDDVLAENWINLYKSL